MGFVTSDDACVYRITDEIAAIHTVDFFTPIVDDPFWFGQIAAANALSDVYAMGGRPAVAMNLLCVPGCLSQETIRKILEGGHQKAVEAGCVIAGGHTIQDDEPKYGLCVTGYVHPDKALRNVGARPGDALVLTKPLGTGVLTTAAKAQAFEKNYRRMVRYGFLAIALIPLIFLILMFSLESKIIFLVLWIISIIAIALFLIIVEFIHSKLEEQQQLAGMTFDEMLETFRKKED